MNSADVNVIDPIKNNFNSTTEWKISKHYNKTLSISKDKDLELYLKSQPNSCFVNNYSDIGLKAWQATYGHTIGSNINVSIFLWRLMFTSQEISCKGSLCEWHASSLHHENNC